MSMIICEECGKEFSDKAPACPNCGCPLCFTQQSEVSEPDLFLRTIQLEKKIKDTKKNEKRQKRQSILVIVLIFYLILLFVAGINDKRDSNASTKSIQEQVAQSENGEKGSVSETGEVKEFSEKEILFMETPWGISYTEFEEKHGELGLWALSGEGYKTYSVDDIVLNDYEGIQFEYDDINIIGNCFYGEIEVAGYTTKGISLYFAYVPIDGTLSKKEEDSAFYGARYEFEPKNVDEMYNDLINKLSSVYGEPYKTTNDTDLWENKYKYTYWYGQNDTLLVLKSLNTEEDTTGLYTDEIYISYVWLKGDELLQNASDILKQEAINAEKEVYGNDSTDGL